MGNISVRRLDEATLGRLRQRAQQRGVSMEEEVRRILQSALAEPTRIGDLALSSFGAAHGVEPDLPSHGVHPSVALPG
ncbi:MAG: hypothetical protein DCF24_11795 [Cyanobium sp.]|nr:MAG: hypothetical protein DCF24_11795 [Cyanobium sp.]